LARERSFGSHPFLEKQGQDVQVEMPVQKLPGGLDGDDGGWKSVASRIFTEERGKSLPGAQAGPGRETGCLFQF
jgi:hypothetical protein